MAVENKDSNVVVAENLSRTYGEGETLVHAVDGISFTLKRGELTIIVGPSGAGKSTLLNLLGGMEIPTGGHLFVDGEDIAQYNKKQLTLYRRNKVGFVFQFYNLMPNLTAKENIELSNELKKDSLSPEEALKAVGLSERMNNFPSQLSGGEQQRVSIARALAKNPEIVLCDEPTGALDYVTGKEILSLLSDAARVQHKNVIIVTHNSALTEMADHLLRIRNGKILEEKYNPTPKNIQEIEW